MKKRIMKSTLAVALVAAAAFGGMKTYGAYAGTAESEQLLSENVEALTYDGDPGGTRYKCYASTHYKENAYVVFCDDCIQHRNQTDDLLCLHDWCYR